jgi:hypothetical protein
MTISESSLPRARRVAAGPPLVLLVSFASLAVAYTPKATVVKCLGTNGQPANLPVNGEYRCQTFFDAGYVPLNFAPGAPGALNVREPFPSPPSSYCQNCFSENYVTYNIDTDFCYSPGRGLCAGAQRAVVHYAKLLVTNTNVRVVLDAHFESLPNGTTQFSFEDSLFRSPTVTMKLDGCTDGYLNLVITPAFKLLAVSQVAVAGALPAGTQGSMRVQLAWAYYSIGIVFNESASPTTKAIINFPPPTITGLSADLYYLPTFAAQLRLGLITQLNTTIKITTLGATVVDAPLVADIRSFLDVNVASLVPAGSPACGGQRASAFAVSSGSDASAFFYGYQNSLLTIPPFSVPAFYVDEPALEVCTGCAGCIADTQRTPPPPPAANGAGAAGLSVEALLLSVALGALVLLAQCL